MLVTHDYLVARHKEYLKDPKCFAERRAEDFIKEQVRPLLRRLNDLRPGEKELKFIGYEDVQTIHMESVLHDEYRGEPLIKADLEITTLSPKELLGAAGSIEDATHVKVTGPVVYKSKTDGTLKVKWEFSAKLSDS